MSEHKKSNIKEIGRIAEQKFQQWLIHKGLLFAYFDQTPATFAPPFKEISVKRPDYLICMKDLGTIAVDVKSRRFYKDFENFTLDEEEIQKLSAFQRISRIPVWFAISHREIGYNTWYWISLNAIKEKSARKVSSLSRKPFRPISIKECITMGCNDGLEKLYNN